MKVEEIINAIYDGTFEESEGIEFMFFLHKKQKVMMMQASMASMKVKKAD